MSIQLLNGERVYWQAHQSSTTEVPENTMVAFEYAWSLGGIPEADIRTTRDRTIICLHDETLNRTGYEIPAEYRDIPAISLTYEEISNFDVGGKYGEEFIGVGVPTLRQVFQVMKMHNDRLLYLDFKDVVLSELVDLIDEYEIGSQIIFTHNSHENCMTVKDMAESIRTMLWIGGDEESIKEKFQKALAAEFKGLDQVQLHLNDRAGDSPDWRYDIDIDYLKYAYDMTGKFDVVLEVLPFEFTEEDIHTLLDIGIRWFAIDYPKRFVGDIRSYL